MKCCRFAFFLAVLTVFLALTAQASSTGQRRSNFAPVMPPYVVPMDISAIGAPIRSPSSPDNWIGGSGNWSDGADWSAGQPGSNSDVTINTGNDNVTLDTSSSINSLTLGGTSGSSQLMSDGSEHTLTIAAMFTVNQSGNLYFSGDSISSGGFNNLGTVDLENGGSLQVNGSAANSRSLILGASGDPGGSLTVTGALTNSGSFEVGFGGSDVTVGGLNNTGAIVVGGEFDSSLLQVNGNASSSGSIQLYPFGGMNVTGNLTNSGILGFPTGSFDCCAVLRVDGVLTNSAAGSLTLQGDGSIADVGSLVNQGQIMSSGTDISFTVEGNATNSGTIQSLSGGNLNFRVGGTLTNQGVVSAQVLNVGGNLINQASGTIEGSMAGSTMSVTGELSNNGTVDSRYGSAVFGSLNNPGGGVILSGADTILGNVSNDGNILVVSLGENEPLVSFAIGGNLVTSGLLNVAGSEGAGASATAAGSITNTISGIIEVDKLSSLDSASITNSGTIRTGVQGINPGGNTVQANTLNNLAAGIILLGGAGDTGQFGYVSNAGSISIASGATLNVVGAHAGANASPGVLNSGIVLINSGGTLFSARPYTQTGGQITVDGLLHLSGNGIANFAGGSVYGNGGTVEGSIISNAEINIGDSPMTVGQLAFMGNYMQGANGSLTFDIAGASSGQYDQLNVSGRATLNGLMTVDLLHGFIPQIGDNFDIMNFASESGTFSMVVGLPINSQEHFVLEYNSTNLTLDVVAGQSSNPSAPAGTGGGSASEPFIAQGEGSDYLQLADNHGSPATVPEPGSVLLFGSGLAGLGMLRRK